MKNKILIIFLILVLAVFSLNIGVFGQDVEINQEKELEIKNPRDCPIEGAYFISFTDEGEEIYAECLDNEWENDPGWYRISGESNEKIRIEVQASVEWVDGGLKIKNREDEIVGINLLGSENDKNESIKILFASTGSVFKWGENEITNIINSGEGSYYYIDFNTIKERIESASLIIGHDGSNITFNGQKFFAPTGTAIIFNDDDEENPKITLRGESSIQDLFRYLKSGESLPQISISGRDLEISPDLTLINGQISIHQNGFLLEEGIANYRQMQFKTEDENILFANENTDLSEYQGNWILQNQNELRMQSSDTGTISAKILENHEILNSDSLDRAEFTITSGDGILIKSRNSQGLIPTLEHLSSDSGETTIQNGRLFVSISENEISLSELSGFYEDNFDDSGHSLAMEIFLRENSTKMIINSHGQFLISGLDNSDLITYNKYGLPISSRIVDNYRVNLEDDETLDFGGDFHKNFDNSAVEEINSIYSGSHFSSKSEDLSVISRFETEFDLRLDEESLNLIANNVRLARDLYNIEIRFVGFDSDDSTTGMALHYFSREGLNHWGKYRWNVLVMYNYAKNEIRFSTYGPGSNIDYSDLYDIKSIPYAKNVLMKDYPNNNEISLMLADISNHILILIQEKSPVTNDFIPRLGRISLKSHEYVVPNEVLKAFYVVTMDSRWELANPQGLYISRNFLRNRFFDLFDGEVSKRRRFERLLMEHTNFKESEVDRYFDIVTTRGNIVLPYDYDESTVFHERIHKIITEELSYREKRELINTRNSLKTDLGHYNSKMDKFRLMSDFMLMAIDLGNWQEIYAHISQYVEKYPELNGPRMYMDENVLEMLRLYPESYEIYRKVVNMASE